MSASTVIAEIQSQLRRSWAPPSGDGPAMTRVTTMNLVVASTNPESIEHYAHIVDDVAQTIPARTLLVSLDTANPVSDLQGEATAVSSLSEGSNVCSERIQLRATGETSLRIASVVEALLVPELPTAVVWLGRVHVNDPTLQAMAALAQRFILDTEYTSITSLLAFAKWTGEENGQTFVADIAWTRLSPWQELVARFFDRDAAPLAEGIEELELTQASESGAKLGSEGALMLGWLGSRLGWKVSRLGGRLAFTRRDGKTVKVTFKSIARPKGVAPLALASFTLKAKLGEDALDGSIVRDLASGLDPATVDADVLVWKIARPGGTPFEQHVRLGPNKGAKWLARTLQRPANDPSLTESALFACDFYDDDVVCT